VLDDQDDVHVAPHAPVPAGVGAEAADPEQALVPGAGALRPRLQRPVDGGRLVSSEAGPFVPALIRGAVACSGSRSAWRSQSFQRFGMTEERWGNVGAAAT